VSSSSKLIAGTIVVAVVAAGGAAFAAMKLSDSANTYPEPAVTAPYGGGIGGSSLGGGRLGGRGFGGGLGPGQGFRFGGFFGATSSAVTGYLGVTAAALRSDMQNGETLAQVAKAQGKTVAGLVALMVAGQKKLIDDAVSDGRLTQAQAQQFESSLQQRITEMVNGTRPHFGGPGAPAPPGQTA
jgi:hypothetical protein